MTKKLFFVLGIVFGLIPLYTFLAWIYVYNKFYNNLSCDEIQASCEKLEKNYADTVVFGFESLSRVQITFFSFLIGLISIGIFAFFVMRYQINKDKGLVINKLHFRICLVLLILFSLINLLNVFPIL